MNIIKNITLFIFMLWCLGFFYFSHQAEQASNYSRNSTDAIISLGDSKQHLYSIVQLVKAGYAPLVFISSEYPAEHYQNFFMANNLITEQVIVGHQQNNAGHGYIIEIRDFIQKYQLNSIRLIADAYQMPRALIELPLYLPAGVGVTLHPITVNHHDYYHHFVEYVKYTILVAANYIGLAAKLSFNY